MMTDICFSLQEQIDDEEVTYSRNENIAVYLGEDGSFNLQDYNKVR